MGFFSKLKENFQHGGVKIVITAPPVIAQNATEVAIQATITAGAEPHRITNVSVSLDREEYERYDSSTSGSRTSSAPSVVSLSRQDTNQPFDLPAGQTATINVTLPLDSIARIENPTMQKVAGIMNTLSKFSSKAGNWTHYITVSANVEGIVLDPSARQRVQLEGQESSHFSMRIGV